MVRIVVSGALGRMGGRIIELAEKNPEFNVVGKIEKIPRPDLNIVSDLNEIKDDYDCIIEFTTPGATVGHVKIARARKKAIVIGTTGLSNDEIEAVSEASKNIPIVLSPNMSVGVNLFFSLIGKTAKILGREYKVNIREAHHVHKKDKPSGTARFMANIIREKLGDIETPIDSIREGEIVGDHDIIFESKQDILKISHSAKSRDIFAIGALKAAKFIVNKERGLFSMSDVLAL